MYRFASLREADKDLSSQEYWALAGANAELRFKNLKDARVYSETICQLREKYLKKLHSLIGKDNLEKYLGLHQKRLEKMKKARKKLPPTIEGLEKLRRLRGQIVQKSNKLIDGSDIDAKEVQKLQRKFAEKAAALNRKTISKGKGPHVDTGDGDHSGNQTYHPPYLGEDSEDFQFCTRGTASSMVWTDRLTGEVGGETDIRINDADDADVAFAICRPRMRIVKTMDRPGPLTVRVELETIRDQINGSYDDECGVSGYDFHQRLFVYAQRTWPHPSMRIYRELNGGSYFHHDRIGPMRMLSWIADFSDPRDTNTVDLIIPAPPSEERDMMMGIDVGFEMFNYCWVNDVSISGQMRNSYFITEIRLLT